MRHMKTTGTCTDCGKEDCDVIVLDDVARVCEECLETNYTQCSICGEYWYDSYVEFTFTDDQIICEYCMEDIEED